MVQDQVIQLIWGFQIWVEDITSPRMKEQHKRTLAFILDLPVTYFWTKSFQQLKTRKKWMSKKNSMIYLKKLNIL